MFPSFRIGAVFGFPIRLNLSFLLLLGFVLLWMGGLAGVAVALLAFGSVLLHELGHALMARHLRVGVSSIDLHFFGGAAQMTDLPRTPGDEIAIAAAGPAVSFALAGLGHGLGFLTGIPLLAWLGTTNLIIGAFNLLPAFPSDGGRILRALLAPKRGLVAATDLAVKIGRGVLVALALIGLFVFQSFQLAIVAAVLWTMGGAERLAVRMRGGWDEWRGTPRRVEAVEYIPPPRSTSRPPRVVVWRW
jgi:Zn-dependent protease